MSSSDELTLFDDPGPSGPPDDGTPLQRVRMTGAYDGSGFRGFAANPGVTTVGGTLEGALERLVGRPVPVTCAGRTDAGVHARGQVVSFDVPADRFDPERLTASLHRLCGPEIAVRDLGAAPDDFDARSSATGRLYRYQVLAAPVADPLLRHVAWHVRDPLDLSLLRLGCDPLIGEHDFSSFCRMPRPRNRPPDAAPVSLVRRVRTARWEAGPDGLLWFWIEANAFCHQMVRSIVGTLVEVGAGRRRPGDLLGVIRARDRSAAGQLAPPHGLTLWQVTY